MKANGKLRMKIHADSRAVAGLVGALWAVSILASPEVAEPNAPYRIGQYWEYNLKGPRPEAVEPKAIDGQRIVQVVGNVAADANERRVIEEKFTNDPNVIGRLHVGSDRMLRAAVIANEKNAQLLQSDCCRCRLHRRRRTRTREIQKEH